MKCQNLDACVILSCCFNRFKQTASGGTEKNEAAIEVPAQVDVERFIHSSSLDAIEQESRYTTIGIVVSIVKKIFNENCDQNIQNHAGSLVAGHYTAVCSKAGDWVQFDDELITSKLDTILQVCLSSLIGWCSP